MPGRWLLKSEPGDYSFDDLEREGRAIWDGVKNPAALKQMRGVEPGDEAFFYHTGSEKAIVGIARVVTEAYSDPHADDERLLVFEVRPLKRLPRPVTLSEIKGSGGFGDWELVRIPRLSVMPVSADTWSKILEMARS